MIERLSGLEDAKNIPRWIDSVHNATPIVLSDINISKETNLAEYELYRRLDVDALASPFLPNITGFLVVRKPTRYLKYPSAMFIFAYILHRAMA